MYDRVPELAILLIHENGESTESAVDTALHIVSYLRAQAGVKEPMYANPITGVVYYQFGDSMWFKDPKTNRVEMEENPLAGAFDYAIDYTDTVNQITRLAKAIADTNEADELKAFYSNVGIDEDLDWGLLLIKQIVYCGDMTSHGAMIKMALLAGSEYTSNKDDVQYLRNEIESNTFTAVSMAVKDAIYFGVEEKSDILEMSYDCSTTYGLEIDHDLVKHLAAVGEGLLERHFAEEE